MTYLRDFTTAADLTDLASIIDEWADNGAFATPGLVDFGGATTDDAGDVVHRVHTLDGDAYDSDLDLADALDEFYADVRSYEDATCREDIVDATDSARRLALRLRNH